MTRAPMHRREIFWGAAAFALGQLALAVSVDRFLPEVRDPEFAAKARRLRARLAELPGRPLMLMLGSSRTMNGFCAAMLCGHPGDDRPVAFNFAVPGGGPFMQRICFERLRAGGIKPDILLIELLPAFYNHQRDEYL